MIGLYRFVSLRLWGNLPSKYQRKISEIYTSLYNKSFSRLIISPYCKYNNLDDDYLHQFKPASGGDNYISFQDFFTRVYKEPLKIDHPYIWPCEGLLCDYGRVEELEPINVKGDRRNIKTIFGEVGDQIEDDYYFSNVFLHNNNYHRIHSPVSGTIQSIEHIEGDLVLLRPWVYKNDPSLPAMRNERVNITIKDYNNRKWFLSIEGGPAVGTIELPDNIKLGQSVEIGEECAKFLLGSTLCMATPQPTSTPINSTVYVANRY